MVALNSNLASGLLTSLNTGAVDGGVGERVLIDYKDAIQAYKVVDLPALSMFCQPMTTDTGGDIDITFAKPSMGMEEINEGNTPKYQHTNLRSERVSVDEWGLAVGVTRRMIEDSRFNEVEMALNEARRAVDRHVTKHVVYALFGVGDTTLKTGLSGGASSILVSTTEAVITTFADCPNGGFIGTGGTVNSGRIYSYGNTSDAILTTPHYTVDTGAAGNVILSLITDAMELIGGGGMNANALLISPGHYKTILNMADFTSTVAQQDRYVLDTPIEKTSITGLIGSIYGLKVYVNAWCPPDRYLVWDETVKPIAYVERRPLTVEEANPGFGIVGSYMSMRYGLKITQPSAGVVMYNTG
tara:strand:- start:184 stop:1254 length:1071 start_codon:yes stop_codon:yes gene_type:complete